MLLMNTYREWCSSSCSVTAVRLQLAVERPRQLERVQNTRYGPLLHVDSSFADVLFNPRMNNDRL